MADHGIPAELVERLLAVGPVEWGATDEKTDAEHRADHDTTLFKTRDHFDLPILTQMHQVSPVGKDTILAITGNSPNGGNHARLLVGAWNHLYEQALKTEAVELRDAYRFPWGEDTERLSGIVYGHSRCPDGMRVTTTPIKEELPGDVFRTKNTLYRITSWAIEPKKEPSE
jgi:hypothetical protein